MCGAFTFKNEPLVLALTAPITSSDSAGVVVPTPKLVPNEPDDTIDNLLYPKMSLNYHLNYHYH